MNRRKFLKATAAGIAAAAGAESVGIPVASGAEKGERGKTGGARRGRADGKPIPMRTLGRTGESLSIIGFGGIVAIGGGQEAADRIVAEAFDRGVNYFDVAPSYGDGEAEQRLGPALKPYRERVFLACKTTERTKEGAEAELNRSLKRLETDHFDLYQLHALSKKEEVEKALGPGGAMETFVKARKDGKVRFIGFSAHSVEAALLAMERFSFDTILFPFNWVCWAQGGFGPQVLEAARRKEMGCLALKAMARTPWPEGAQKDYPKCWYQPVTQPEEAALALRFTLSLPVTAAIPPGEERFFRMALSIAEKFQPLGEEDRKGLLARAREQKLKPIFEHRQA